MNEIRNIVSRLRENRLLQEKQDYSRYSRDELINLAQEGDAFALETLVKSHKDLISMIARKYFLSSGDQDDLEQVGTIGFWQAVMDWNGKGDFDAFAGMYIKRYIAKELDKEAAEKSRIHTDADSMDAKVSADGEDDRTLGDTLANPLSLEDDVVGREGVRALRKFLEDNFNEKEREVIQKYIDGYKVKEIAEVLDMPYKSAENILYKIKYKLKEYMRTRDSFKESKKLSEDLEFSEEEKQMLRSALSQINEDKRIKESYEEFTDDDIEDKISDYESMIEDIVKKIKRTDPEEYPDAFDDLLYELDSIQYELKTMEPHIPEHLLDMYDNVLIDLERAEDTGYDPSTIYDDEGYYYDDRY